MNTCIERKTAIKLFITIITLTLCFAIIIFSESCAKGAANGIETCLSVLIPSLFPFMAVSSFIIQSGLSQTLGKPFKRFMKKIFGLDGCYAPIFLLSLIGGYPVGARGISELYKSGQTNLNQAKKAALTTVCAGPGFMINYIGTSLYGNIRIGFILLISQIISVFIIGITVNFFDKNKNDFNYDLKYKPVEYDISNSIVYAAYDSAKGIMNICIFVVLFSAVIGIFKQIIHLNALNQIVNIALEVCSAVKSLSTVCPVEAVAFAAGFGGLCVHFQIFSALEQVKINKIIFFFTRIFQGIITALFTHMGMLFFAEDIAVFSTGNIDNPQSGSSSVVGSVVLVAVMVCFLFALKSCKNNIKHN